MSLRSRSLVFWVICSSACGARTGLELDSSQRQVTAESDAPGAGPSKPRALCVFDYDLTLSSHKCAQVAGDPDYFCRVNTCGTYGWYEQCLGVAASAAVAECVRRGAYIGIASHADADSCWADKVTTVVTEEQFPQFTRSKAYGNTGSGLSYPRIDDRDNWNCDDCAYTMDGTVSKPEGIRRIMRHYGLDPASAKDQARVIFWDDTPDNIVRTSVELPAVHGIEVPRFTSSGFDGGCGLTTADIDRGWAALEN
jgi:hypothetical protein